MATQLTVPGLLVKWLVVPAALGFAGYFLIGERIGANSMHATTEQEAKIQAATEAALPPVATPEVRVASSSDDLPKPKRKKKRVVHHKKKAVVNPENSVTPSNDENFPMNQPPGSDTTEPPPSEPKGPDPDANPKQQPPKVSGATV